MQVIEYGADDVEAVETGRRILNATREFETPWLPPLTPHRRTMQVRHGWDGTPDRHYLAWVDGVAVGTAHLEYGEWDNLDLAWTNVIVHPSYRRRGHGSACLAQLMSMARERGATKIGADGWDLPGVTEFLTGHGFVRASQEVYRVQDLRALPPALAEEAYAEAAAHASSYELLRMQAPSPEDLLPALAELTAAINDAPFDDLDIEPEVFPVERVRAYERATVESGHRLYRVVARETATGRFGGHTLVAVDEERPELAHQHDTSVLREHRGHRLGLLLKADMVRWLLEAEPQVERVATWNAETNDHMVGVNERLGYRVVGRQLEFQRRL